MIHVFSKGRQHFRKALGLIIVLLVLSRTDLLIEDIVRNIGMVLAAQIVEVPSRLPQRQPTGLDASLLADRWLGRDELGLHDRMAHLGLGWIWDAQGDLERAGVEWKKANLSAEMFLERGDQALDVGRAKEASNDYERAFAMSSHYVSAYHYRRHSVFIAMNQEAAALRALHSAIDEDQGWLNSAERLDAWTSWGLRLYGEGQYEAAENALREAVRVAGDSSGTVLPALLSRTYYWLGRSLSKQKRFLEASAAYQSAILSDPENVDAYMHYGLATWYLGDLDKSAGALRKALQLSPQRPWAYVWLANVLYERDQDITTSEQMLTQAVQIGAEDPAILEAAVRFWKEEVKDRTRMLASCRQIRQVSPETLASVVEALCDN